MKEDTCMPLFANGSDITDNYSDYTPSTDVPEVQQIKRLPRSSIRHAGIIIDQCEAASGLQNNVLLCVVQETECRLYLTNMQHGQGQQQ